MSPLRALMLAWTLLLGRPELAAAQEPYPPYPAEVTSDSMAYCQHLARRVIDLRVRTPIPLPDVDDLLMHGQKLCAQGRVRMGLNRLRHALLELHEIRRDP